MAQFQFVMRGGPNVGKVFPLEAQEITIGRDNNNTIPVNDGEISRKHAKLSWHGTTYVLQDLGSTNGSFVNGTRVAGTQVLNPGDTVSFGEIVSFSYEALFDANATMASGSKPPRTAVPVQRAAPAPAPAYSGQVPAGPAPASVAPAKKGSGKLVIIIIVAVVVCLILACIASLIYVDADPTGARWCSFPFSILARMFGGVCP